MNHEESFRPFGARALVAGLLLWKEFGSNGNVELTRWHGSIFSISPNRSLSGVVVQKCTAQGAGAFDLGDHREGQLAGELFSPQIFQSGEFRLYDGKPRILGIALILIL